MFESLHRTMIRHALDALPRPACGGIFGEGDEPAFVPVRGAVPESRGNFDLEMSVLRRLEDANGPLRAIVYSHPTERKTDIEAVLFTPSASEMRWQMAAEVPFLIAVASPGGVADLFWFGDQCPVPPLVGRIFRHGVTDCYSLCRDWYRLERNVRLPEFPRDWDWWTGGREGPNLYVEGFGRAGFYPIERAEARAGDSALFCIRSKVPNHAAVLLEDGWMIHHSGYMSPIDPMRISQRARIDRWARHASHWLRHESLGDR